MLEGVSSRHPIAIIVNQKFSYDFLGFRRDVWNQFRDSSAFLFRKVELHMACDSVKIFILNLNDLRLTFRTSEEDHEMVSQECYEFCALGQAHYCLGREGKEPTLQSRHNPLPNNPSCDYSIRPLASTQGVGTIWLRYTL